MVFGGTIEEFKKITKEKLINFNNKKYNEQELEIETLRLMVYTGISLLKKQKENTKLKENEEWKNDLKELIVLYKELIKLDEKETDMGIEITFIELEQGECPIPEGVTI
ncbi:MAG TPA: hypothetical protein PL110_05070 [Candidatus Eremiobacteraeota bacterium]|nr:MAG: hypothetical protein BWY64_00669 [bacterium ADurb.Bin363]HPZ07462.1 hypothetical protein [Candidatus Eremiobacteraeota bacterium]